MPRLPNFFVIGAQKSGSSWLAQVLAQHPDIFVAPREIHYFDKVFNLERGLDWYLSHFEGAGQCHAVGEKTPEYFWAGGAGAEGHNPDVHRLITEAFPNAKYLVVLRNPVDRAVSALVHMVKTNRLPLVWPLEQLFEERHRSLLEPWGVLEKGLYARQLQAYLDRVPSENIKALIFEEDIRRRPKEALSSVCEYLGVDATFAFSELARKRNRSPITRKALQQARAKQCGRTGASLWLSVRRDEPVRITPETRRRLLAYYGDENERLFSMLGRRIPEWAE